MKKIKFEEIYSSIDSIDNIVAVAVDSSNRAIRRDDLIGLLNEIEVKTKAQKRLVDEAIELLSSFLTVNKIKAILLLDSSKISKVLLENYGVKFVIMRLKKFEVEDLKTFERDKDGRLICPTGNYAGIKSFPDQCLFGDDCSFDKCSSFGHGCVFGHRCKFGAHCSFGDDCSFGAGCGFGSWCSISGRSRFGDHCSPEERCKFAELKCFNKLCRGLNCTHDGRCAFWDDLRFVDIPDNVERVFKIDGIGRTKTDFIYFFQTPRHTYVYRSGSHVKTVTEDFECEVLARFVDWDLSFEERAKAYLDMTEHVKSNFPYEEV